MVLVPGGSFMMGEGEDDGPRDPRDPPDWPPHPVTVSSFLLDTREVTNGEYQKFLEATGSPHPKGWDDGRKKNWANLPVTGVTWVDAENFARWSGKRLPTEEEWEFAARGHREPCVSLGERLGCKS